MMDRSRRAYSWFFYALHTWRVSALAAGANVAGAYRGVCAQRHRTRACGAKAEAADLIDAVAPRDGYELLVRFAPNTARMLITPIVSLAAS